MRAPIPIMSGKMEIAPAPSRWTWIEMNTGPSKATFVVPMTDDAFAPFPRWNCIATSS